MAPLFSQWLSSPAPGSARRALARIYLSLALAVTTCTTSVIAADAKSEKQFNETIKPLLQEYCYECHGDGMDKGKVTFDEFGSHDALMDDRKLWLSVLKHVRSDIMPPEKKPRPTTEQKAVLENWIKHDVFALNEADPDPGRVTVRRLNRVEYRNTIRDLMGIEYDTQSEFPPDDTGHGFDNISDVLTISPMLLEKYLEAAKVIVDRAVPVVPKVVPENKIPGEQFARVGETVDDKKSGSLSLSYYEATTVSNNFKVTIPGKYSVVLNFSANERFVDNMFDYNKSEFIFTVDGEELHKQTYVRQGGKSFQFVFDREWQTGDHPITLQVRPLTPDEKQIRSLSFRVEGVTLRGPYDEKHWVRPARYERFFTRETPEQPAEREAYASELLRDFANKAFRRPVDDKTVERLAGLAESIYTQPGKTFEAGIAKAMTAVLASPRFLFREESLAQEPPDARYPYVDEYALATRLSYFLWASMPDYELFRLAREGKLRAELKPQVERMMKDWKADAFIRNFVGQWLHARDIESVIINARAVLAREDKPDPEAEKLRARFRELRNKPEASLTAEEKAEFEKIRGSFGRMFRAPRADLTYDLRFAMRRETEMHFEYVVQQNRSLLELLSSDYTFLNEKLAKHYGMTNVMGDNMRLVNLPAGSPRGGLLTQGTVLAVTSNPTRTSPVKRGLFILENVLGTPPPPPPPDIPALEEAAKENKEKLSLRETLELHRGKPLCSSCHNRMDPLGLAFENFNAMGMWREAEGDEAVDVAGKLISGESFTKVQELKEILVNERRHDFYHCLTEKMLTYALGRGLEYYDLDTVDGLVARLEKDGGHASTLIMGVIESVPFQKSRRLQTAQNNNNGSPQPAQRRAELKVKP